MMDGPNPNPIYYYKSTWEVKVDIITAVTI